MRLRWNPGWDVKLAIRKCKAALYAGVWISIFLLPLHAFARSFPLHGSPGDLLYFLGRVSSLFGLLFLAFVICSRNFFVRLKTVMDPVRLNQALYIMEVTGLTLIFLHPLFLVAGRYLAGSPNPLDIIVPNFSDPQHVFIAYGCMAFWMFFLSGIILLNRYSVRLNRVWRYVHLLVYPAFFLALLHTHFTGSSVSNPRIDTMLHLLYLAVSFSIIFRIVDFMLRKRKQILRKMLAGKTPRKEALKLLRE